MAVKLADVSYLRRSPAERFVLRELIWLKQSKVNDPTEGYLALRCQMSETQLRKVLDKLAKLWIISFEARERDTRGYKETFYEFVLHDRLIRQLIAEGEEFVFKTLRERSANSQLGMEATSLGKSITGKEGEANGGIAKVPKATPAPNPRLALPDIPQLGEPEVMEGLSLFQHQAKHKDLSRQDLWLEFCRSDPRSWIKKAKDAKAAKRNTGKT
jgi:hypothetical protein